jgi:hypothetical protein
VSSNPAPHVHEVTLPAGGQLQLQTSEEVDLWRESMSKYIDDYHLTKNNDLVLLGVILQQQVVVYRAQRAINGMEPELDANNIPTGNYKMISAEADEIQAAMKTLTTASDQIQKIEKSLGIDKVTREAGGQQTVASYIQTLKRAAHERGVHISKRVLAYEKFVMDLRMRLRILDNADAEDRAYHDITPEKILEWARDELRALEEVDKKFAREKGRVFVGQL